MPLDNNTPDTRNNPKPVENQLGDNKDANQKEVTMAAHEQALEDIDQDPELNMKPTPEHDLDEGELARFEDGDDLKRRTSTDEDEA